MFNWRYWRWQIIRSAPLAVAVALLVAILGRAALNATPLKYTASARIVLERQIGVASTPKAQRTTEEVQHLQVIIHALKTVISDEITDSEGTENDTSFDLKIETNLDKPTYLLIETTMPNASAAITFADSLSARAAEISEAAQQRQIDTSLNKLRVDFDENERLSQQALDTLNAHQDRAPILQIDDLRQQASQLHAELQTATLCKAPDNLALENLRADLAIARGLYSDLHPKVRLIQTRITRALTQRLPDQPIEALQQQLQGLETQISASEAYQKTSHRLQVGLANVTAATQAAQDRLGAAEHAREASRMHLKIVQDATLTGRSPEKIQAMLLSAILLTSLFAAIAAVALLISSDRHLRRPRDLHRTLGLTTFATLPDLGPSFG